MNRKLTLSLDETTIKHAKQYAERNHQSLSELVERYFRYVTKTRKTEESRDTETKGLVTELGGMIRVPETLDERLEYHQHRAEKTLHG